MIPALVRIKAHEIREFWPLLSHEGEDLLYIVEGEVNLHTEYYAPVRLAVGDCAYFDSRMGHGCVSCGPEDAVIFWVCSSELSAEILGGGGADMARGES